MGYGSQWFADLLTKACSDSFGHRAGIRPEHAQRLRLILTALNAARSPKDMDLPGLRLHPLKGERQGSWAVSVSGNWRVIFRFDGNDALNVDYDDYH